MEQLNQLLPQPSSTEQSYEDFIRSSNARSGREMGEGYDCPICHNKEMIRVIENGVEMRYACKCHFIRQNMRRLRVRGLGELSQHCTFQSFTTNEPWQRNAKEAAIRYEKSDLSRWFFISGQSGSGKTHLCTAIAGSLITKGHDVQVYRWVEFAAKAKSVIGDSTAYANLVQPVKDCEILYLDDFLKVQNGQAPTAADIRLAFEILDARYCSPKKAVILSSEFSWERMNQFDAAVAGRIHERSESFMIQLQYAEGRNYRLR